MAIYKSRYGDINLLDDKPKEINVKSLYEKNKMILETKKSEMPQFIGFEQSENFNIKIINKLASKMYLDLDDKDNITMELKFCYEDFEFNILDDNIKVPKNIKRDIDKEGEVLSRIFQDGFELVNSKKYFVLM